MIPVLGRYVCSLMPGDETISYSRGKLDKAKWNNVPLCRLRPLVFIIAQV